MTLPSDISFKPRHYALFIDADTITPDNSKMWAEAIRALLKDPSCIICASPTTLFNAVQLGVRTVRIYAIPGERAFYIHEIKSLGPTRWEDWTYPSPWSAHPGFIVQGVRAALTDDYRAGLWRVR